MDKNKQKEILGKIAPMAPIMKERITKADKDVIKAFFKDEWISLTIVRDLFFGFTISEFEKGVVRGFTADLKKTLKKIFCPELSKDNPIGSAESADLWSGVPILQIPFDMQVQNLKAQRTFLEMMKTAVKLLDDPDGEKVDLDVVIPEDEAGQKEAVIKTIAHQWYVRLVEQQLIILNTFAYQTEETPTEMENRLKRDSMK